MGSPVVRGAASPASIGPIRGLRHTDRRSGGRRAIYLRPRALPCRSGISLAGRVQEAYGLSNEDTRTYRDQRRRSQHKEAD
jgi:hypothetical protein